MNKIYRIKKSNEKNEPNKDIMVSTYPLYLNYLYQLVRKYEINGTLKVLYGYFKDIDVENVDDGFLFKAYHLLKFTLIVYGTENVGGPDVDVIKDRIDEFVVEFFNDLFFWDKTRPNLYLSPVKGGHDDTDMSFNIVGLYDDKDLTFTEDLIKVATRPAFIKVIYNNQPVTSPFDALEEISEENYCCAVVKDSIFCATNHYKSDYIQVFDFADMINAILTKTTFDSSLGYAMFIAENYLILPPVDTELFA